MQCMKYDNTPQRTSCKNFTSFFGWSSNRIPFIQNNLAFELAATYSSILNHIGHWTRILLQEQFLFTIDHLNSSMQKLHVKYGKGLGRARMWLISIFPDSDLFRLGTLWMFWQIRPHDRLECWKKELPDSKCTQQSSALPHPAAGILSIRNAFWPPWSLSHLCCLWWNQAVGPKIQGLRFLVHGPRKSDLPIPMCLQPLWNILGNWLWSFNGMKFVHLLHPCCPKYQMIMLLSLRCTCMIWGSLEVTWRSWFRRGILL